MTPVAEKLKNSRPTLTGQVAHDFLKELASNPNYVYYSSEMFNEQGDKLYQDFLLKFLSTQAYMEDSEGTRVPDFMPFHIAHTNTTHPQLGPMEHWLGWWSNCWVLVTEYEQHPERNSTLLAITKATYDDVMKILDVEHE